MAFQFTYIKKSLFLLLWFYFFSPTNSCASNNQVPKFISTVFNNLYSSMDNGNVLKPKLVLSDNRLEVVSYYPSRNEIHIGKGFVDLARNFRIDSSNVIAHVLGHELTHILIQKNAAIKEVGSGYASRAYNTSVRKLYKQLKDSIYERQADEYACFYAHISGYNVVDTAPSILDSIYSRFKLKDSQLKNYPKLEERKRIAIISGKRMMVLNDLFDKAIIATIAKKIEIAKELYIYILEKGFRSPEIYNNLGCTYLSKAIELVDTAEFPYIFPTQIDFKTNLYKPSERFLKISNEELLKDALYYFERANQKNDKYYISILNKAIVQFIQGNIDDFEISILLAGRSKNNEIKEKVNLLKLIHEHKKGNKQNALAEITKLSKQSDLAKLNLSRLKNNVQNEFSTPKEVENKLTFLDFYSDEAKKTDTLLTIFGKKKSLSIRTLETENYKVQKIRCLLGSKKPSVLIYSSLTNTEMKKSNFIDASNSIESIFTFQNFTYIKCGSSILKFKKEELINTYKVF